MSEVAPIAEHSHFIAARDYTSLRGAGFKIASNGHQPMAQ